MRAAARRRVPGETWSARAGCPAPSGLEGGIFSFSWARLRRDDRGHPVFEYQLINSLTFRNHCGNMWRVP